MYKAQLRRAVQFTSVVLLGITILLPVASGTSATGIGAAVNPTAYTLSVAITGLAKTKAACGDKNRESCDWRKSGLLRPPSNQGSQRACFAFTATHVYEDAYRLQLGASTKFEPTAPIFSIGASYSCCDEDRGNCGSGVGEGGYTCATLKYLAKYGAVPQACFHDEMLAVEAHYCPLSSECEFHRNHVLQAPFMGKFTKPDRRPVPGINPVWAHQT